VTSRKERSKTELITSAVFLLILLGVGYFTGIFDFKPILLLMLFATGFFFIFVIPAIAIERWRNSRLRRKTKIEVDEEKLTLHFRKEIKYFGWTQILTAQKRIDGKEDDFIEFVTAEQIIKLSPFWFDLAEVWLKIEPYLSVEALLGRNYKELPFYQVILKEEKQLLKETFSPLSVGYCWSLKVGFVVFGLVLIGSGFWGLTASSLLVVKLVSSFIVLWGLWLITFSITAQLTMTSDKLETKKLWWHKQMRWSEIQKIEFDHNFGRVIFKSRDRKISFTSPQNWFGKDKEKMIQMLNVQVEHLGINYSHSYPKNAL